MDLYLAISVCCLELLQLRVQRLIVAPSVGAEARIVFRGAPLWASSGSGPASLCPEKAHLLGKW